ncbi:hypothetical protein [Streptomyces sp. DSM 41931]|uniref:hypothetical protein n=1 Tax=Streptomyces sp. DSM 41931 TaxID=3418367 RepID=UPI003CFC7B71
MADKQDASRPPSEADREVEQVNEGEKRKGPNWSMYSFFVNAARFAHDVFDKN